MKEEMASIAVAFSGRIGSAKSAVASAVADKLGAPRVGFGDYVRSVASFAGINNGNREVWQDVGSLLIKYPREFCSKVLGQAQYRRGSTIVIEGIRHSIVVDELRIQVAPAELIHIHISVDDATIHHRLQDEGISDPRASRLEVDPTEAEVLTILPERADKTFKYSNLDTPGQVADEIISWLQNYSPQRRHESSEDIVPISRLELDLLYKELDETREKLLRARADQASDGPENSLHWNLNTQKLSTLLLHESILSDSDLQRRMAIAIDYSTKLVLHCVGLRAPHSPDQCKNGFKEWLTVQKEILSPEIRELLATHVPELVTGVSNKEVIDEPTLQFVWQPIEQTLRTMAVKGIAVNWLSRNLGDNIQVAEPIERLGIWLVRISLTDVDLGYLTINSDGEVLQGSAPRRKDVLERLNAN